MNNMLEDTPAFRIRRALFLRGMRASALAKALGVSAAAVSQWLSGRSRPDPARAAQIAMILGVEASDLLAAEQPVDRVLSVRLAEHLLVMASTYFEGDEEHLHRLKVVRGAENAYALPLQFLHSVGATGVDLGVVIVDSNSMRPALENGDRVLVDFGSRVVDAPGVYILTSRMTPMIARCVPSDAVGTPHVRVTHDDDRYASSEMALDSKLKVFGRVIARLLTPI